MHILNLVVKSILNQFEVSGARPRLSIMDEWVAELRKLASNLDKDNLKDAEEDYMDEPEEVDNKDRWIDEQDEMADEEEVIQPIRFVLTKVSHTTRVCCTVLANLCMPQICKLVFVIKSLSTIALSQWFCILDNLSLNKHMIPCDVCTCWNSTYSGSKNCPNVWLFRKDELRSNWIKYQKMQK